MRSNENQPIQPPVPFAVATWRILLRWLGALLLMFVVGLWVAKGSHGGWTQIRVLTVQLDPITELENPVWVDRFVPGVDFLLFGVVLSAGLVAATFFGRRKT